ncbi:MAG: hypothetical protein P8Z73_04285 [Desulfobacteraceae bacterium]
MQRLLPSCPSNAAVFNYFRSMKRAKENKEFMIVSVCNIGQYSKQMNQVANPSVAVLRLERRDGWR